MFFGALEAGGTKMVLAIGNENGEIIDQKSIPTRAPAETMNEIITYFRGKEIAALGIGSFGPIDLDRASKTYGYITSTPKLDWRNYDITGTLRNALSIPVGFDTDVNASALGEATWGGLKDVPSGIYITIGTGIGVGVYMNGELLHGMLHPEAGHILLSRHPEDHFGGVCPYHSNCFEGLASGPSIEKRWNKKAYDLKDQPEVWELEAYYIAQGLVNFILTLSPHRIILGGGVMHQEQLFPWIRSQVANLLNGYVQTAQLEDMDTYIVPASLDGNQGIMGCIQLAKLEFNRQH
ncbi:ROK family protein [Lachnospiraceae bacterium MD1]|uniref:fructokinase n=1 Tax=Variimorphobacter saccharofermentans TaxID=2755051 RepID=A0A839JZ92_9FIRM|nr:ROK family protein [Variimorphobacter saccharofermentans]MBB2182720.1 ROK family protein [Variimorphobacter saccharofermentans]